jgi:hypothetical protein
MGITPASAGQRPIPKHNLNTRARSREAVGRLYAMRNDDKTIFTY